MGFAIPGSCILLVLTPLAVLTLGREGDSYQPTCHLTSKVFPPGAQLKGPNSTDLQAPKKTNSFPLLMPPYNLRHLTLLSFHSSLPNFKTWTLLMPTFLQIGSRSSFMLFLFQPLPFPWLQNSCLHVFHLWIQVSSTQGSPTKYCSSLNLQALKCSSNFLHRDGSPLSAVGLLGCVVTYALKHFRICP